MAGLGKTTAQCFSGEAGKLVDAFSKNDTHAHVEMAFNVAMEGPDAGVISHETYGNPAVRKHGHSVAQRRIRQVETLGVVCRVEFAFAVSQDPEIVAVEMPWVNLAVVRV